MINLRTSAKPFAFRGVLAKKKLHELKMYKTIPYTCMQKSKPRFDFGQPKTKTSIRRRSCLTWQERRRSLHSRRHARRCAATSEFMAYSTGCRCTRRRRRSSGGARRRGPHPRFIDATASCEPSPGSAVGHAPAGQPQCRQRFRAAARKVRLLDVHKQQQPAARCTHLLPICPLRRPAQESGMKRAREQRGSERPLYGIQ